MTAKQILIVDDELSIITAVSAILKQAGYEIETAASGQEALTILAQSPAPDLLILDLMLPDIDGYEICRQVRERPFYLPILMLTARDSDWEKGVGLELGADAYMTKPFEPVTLLAQVKAIFRLIEQQSASDQPGEERPLICGPLHLWEKSRRANLSGQPLDLTPTEFDLLRFLMQQPGRVVGRETLLRQVWGYDYAEDSRTVDVHVQRLRGKIEVDPANPNLLRTVRGFGYCLTL